jgi:hypothetical protein
MSAPSTDASSATAPRWAGPKPRMLYFRLNDRDLPQFITGHFDDHLRCLSQFFDVVLIDDNADYDEAVDRHRPDLALFESGVYARAGRQIRNTHTHPDIPKIGFLDADAYCLTRGVFLSDMDDWGVETFFAIATSATGYTPDIADRTYAWPNFADRSVFRTYPGGKTQTIMLSGSRETNYPWRVKVDRILRERFPVREIPHAGWFDKDAAKAMPTGEAYARTLSSALIVPTCGTIAEDLVRKHFEIPASGALLLTERTPAVEAAGFVDMENCVFADESDVADKVEHLLGDPDALAAIAAAGQRLAHERHSIENRDQLRQWYELDRSRRSGQRIVQRGLFAPLALEESGAGPVGVVAAPGIDRILIAEGETLLAGDRPGPAAERFAEVLNYHFEPEAAFGLARSRLASGRPAEARRMLEYSTGVVRKPHGASHPDSVQWAWLIRALLCEGALDRAIDAAAEYPDHHHPQLDRPRAVVAALDGRAAIVPATPEPRTLHPGFGSEPWDSWAAHLAADLTASGETALAERVRGLPAPVLGGASVAPATSSRPARSRYRSIADRARRRLGREWARIRGQEFVPARDAVFPLLGGRRLDVVALVLVPEDVADHAEAMVARDPSGLTVLRVGRTRTAVDPARFVPWGLRSGAEGAVLRRLPALGPSFVVAGRQGAALLNGADLDAAAVVAILPDSAPSTPLEAMLEASEEWRRMPQEAADRAASGLGAPSVLMWERIAGGIDV